MLKQRRYPITGIVVTIVLMGIAGYFFYSWLNRIYDLPTDPEQMILYSLYSLDGGDYESGGRPITTETIDRHPVLGKIEIVDRELRQKIMSALQQGRDEHHRGPTPACFYPRHAIHILAAGRTIDYIICYQCETIEIIEGNRKAGTRTTNASLAVLNNTLKDAGVPLAPYYSDEKKRK